MGSKISKAKCPTPTKTNAVVVTRIARQTVSIPPQDTVPMPPRDTVPIPPRDTIPAPIQETISTIPQDTVPVPLQEVISIVPQEIISTIPQDTNPIPPRDTVPVPPQDIIPMIPHDIVNEILDHLASDSDFRSIQACALISKPWVQPCRRHLFHTAHFTSASAKEWLKIFPVRGGSPAHLVREMRLEIGHIPDKFFECMPWFTDVDGMTFSGSGGFSLFPEPSFWKLPRSVTSLTVSTNVVTLVQVRDIMVQLPNLDDLELSGSRIGVGTRRLLGTGTALKGRFGGRLMLRDTYVAEDVISTLLEIPSGLRFAELEIHCTHNRLPSSAVRLAEACRNTLVKISHTVSLRCKFYPFPLSSWFSCEVLMMQFSDTNQHDTFKRSFDFSNFPHLQEVTFGFKTNGKGGGLPWVSMALSTLRPSTSPHLSVIKLDFSLSGGRLVETMITDMSNDLRRISGEVTRIECEFKGAVSFTVLRNLGFGVVLDSLNVRFRLVGWKRSRSHVDSSHSFLADPSAPHSLKMGGLSLPLASFDQSFCGVGSFSYTRRRLATWTLALVYPILHVYVIGIA